MGVVEELLEDKGLSGNDYLFLGADVFHLG